MIKTSQGNYLLDEITVRILIFALVLSFFSTFFLSTLMPVLSRRRSLFFRETDAGRVNKEFALNVSISPPADKSPFFLFTTASLSEFNCLINLH
jgi:hypothetical protein